MSKNYDAVSRQVACKQNGTKTIAFYQNLEPVKIERYGELISGRVKVMINDFSKGKGDRATKVSYNLDLKTVRMLYQKSNLFVDYAFRETKIIANGQKDRNGKVPAYRASIERKGKTSDGKPMNYPWAVKIENGVATAVPGKVQGSFMEEKGSYVKQAAAEFYMSDIDFLDCIGDIWDFIQNYKRLVANNLIPAGEKKMQEVTDRGTYKKGMQNEVGKAAPQDVAQGNARNASRNAPQDNQQNTQGAPVRKQERDAPVKQASQPVNRQEAETPAATQEPQDAPAAKSSAKGGKASSGSMDLIINEPFVAVSGHAIAKCQTKKNPDKLLTIHFREVTPALEKAAKSNKAVRLPILSRNGELYCMGDPEPVGN